ncbi:MAG: L-threonylcarbamoyladenylate synthase, partial [Culicoidibacterales bacterium]
MLVQKTEEIIKALLSGEVVAFPTDTVYGLGCDANNHQALAKIYQIKHRPLEKPLILFVANQADVIKYVSSIPELATDLMERFWPGPLTIVLPKKAIVSENISSGLATIGLRMPNHPAVLEILQQSQLTLATTSANLSGEAAATSGIQVEATLGNTIQVLDGEAEQQIASTVIEIQANNEYQILREGAISTTVIQQLIMERKATRKQKG